MWSVTSNVIVASNKPVAESNPVAFDATSNASASDIKTTSDVAPTDLSNFAPAVVGTLAAQYAAMQQKGTYTPEAGAAVALQLAPSLKAPLSYKTFSIIDITTVNDASYARMQRYQTDLRAALAPLSKNTTPEISLFSDYVQSKDPKYLDELRTVAQEYADAASAAAKVVVPQDAAGQHIGILNAMEEFSAVLKALADNSGDPITTIALLQTYNDAESNMVVSFNSFATYVAKHNKT